MGKKNEKIIGHTEAALADGLSASEEDGDDQNSNWEVHSNECGQKQ